MPNGFRAGVQTFSKSLETISKFWMPPEG